MILENTLAFFHFFKKSDNCYQYLILSTRKLSCFPKTFFIQDSVDPSSFPPMAPKQIPPSPGVVVVTGEQHVSAMKWSRLWAFALHSLSTGCYSRHLKGGW